MNAISPPEDRTELLHDTFILWSRIFLQRPSEQLMHTMTNAFAHFYVSFVGSDKGLNEEIEKMERNARNVIAGRP